MWLRLTCTFTLYLAYIHGVVSTTTTPKRFSIPATRSENGLSRRSLDGTDIGVTNATKHVVVDFTFGRQKIPVSLDTGSSFTYVASTLDTTASSLGLPALFNPNISATYKDENNASDAYNCAGNSALCVMGLDNVATAGFLAEGMAFGVASYVKPGVFTSGQAATMGFGRQAKTPSTWLPRDQTFWYRIGENLELPYLFTVDIYQTQNGTWDFGYIDTAKYSGEISYVPINTNMTNWNFQMNGFAIGNGTEQAVPEFYGIVDTGGPNIGLPSSIVNPYFESFGGSPSSGSSHTYPCSAYPPPDLVLSLATGDKLVLNSTFLVNPPTSGSGKTCTGRVDDSVQSAYNIGASVLDQKFVVFDHANLRIGFANKSQAGQSGDVSGTPSSTSTSGAPSSTGSSGSSSTSGTPVTGSTTSTGTNSPTASTTSNSAGSRTDARYVYVISALLYLFVVNIN